MITRKRIAIAAAVLAVPVLALAWWLGSPLFLDRTVDEEFPYSAAAVVPEGMTREQVETTMATMAGMDSAALADPMPVMTSDQMIGDAVVKRGAFRDADGFHRGEGSATVYELPDGSHVLRFEDFRVTNGPDLRVLLAAHPDPRGRGDVHGGDYVELGKLKGNVGNQNYPFPEDLSPDGYGSVVIYCKPFQVVFSVAPLSDGA